MRSNCQWRVVKFLRTFCVFTVNCIKILRTDVFCLFVRCKNRWRLNYNTQTHTTYAYTHVHAHTHACNSYADSHTYINFSGPECIVIDTPNICFICDVTTCMAAPVVNARMIGSDRYTVMKPSRRKPMIIWNMYTRYTLKVVTNHFAQNTIILVSQPPQEANSSPGAVYWLQVLTLTELRQYIQDR